MYVCIDLQSIHNTFLAVDEIFYFQLLQFSKSFFHKGQVFCLAFTAISVYQQTLISRN